MPPNDIAALRQAAERHAFASLVRTDGWRLYMTFLLQEQDRLEQGKSSAEHNEYTRAQMLGRLYQIGRDIQWAYEQAGEDNPLKLERKALLERLVGMLYKPILEPTEQKESSAEGEVPRRRSRRAYAGGVE